MPHDFGDDDPTVVDRIRTPTPRIDKRSLPGYDLGVRGASRAWVAILTAGGTSPELTWRIAQVVAQTLLARK